MNSKKLLGIVGGVMVLLWLLIEGAGYTLNNESELGFTISPAEVSQIAGEVSIVEFPTPADEEMDVVTVELVIDGDTVEIEEGRRVRLIGVDTPETVDPNRPAGCFGKEASDFTKAQLTGKKVRLEKDVSKTDRYGRLLRYVWLEGRLFNEILVQEGYAQAVSYPPDVKYQERFRVAEGDAREGERGLWSELCVVTFSPPRPQSTVAVDIPTTSNSAIGSCKYDCSGADKDCGDFNNQAEVQEFFDCCGFTAEDDPMRLDSVGVGDGVVCESMP